MTPVVHYVASEIDLQPQTSLWNYEKTMLIKKNPMPLLISSFDATIRVKRVFHPAPASRGFASHVFLVNTGNLNRYIKAERSKLWLEIQAGRFWFYKLSRLTMGATRQIGPQYNEFQGTLLRTVIASKTIRRLKFSSGPFDKGVSTFTDQILRHKPIADSHKSYSQCQIPNLLFFYSQLK